MKIFKESKGVTLFNLDILLNFIRYRYLFYALMMFPLFGSAQEQEVFLLSNHKSSMNVYLDKMIKRAGETELIMKSIPATDLSIYLFSPGDPRSIIIRTYQKDYELKDATGIPYFPDMLEVNAGDTAVFSMFFDALPAEITEIDVIERVEPFSDGFSFFNVKLSREKDQVKSLRFRRKSDFENSFAQKRKKQAFEGFWLVEKEELIQFKRKKWPPVEEQSRDTVAFVHEENLLRAYYLNGLEYGIEFKVLQDYLSLISPQFEEAETELFAVPKQKIHLKAQWPKTKIVLPGGKRKRKARRALKLTWKKANG